MVLEYKGVFECPVLHDTNTHTLFRGPSTILLGDFHAGFTETARRVKRRDGRALQARVSRILRRRRNRPHAWDFAPWADTGSPSKIRLQSQTALLFPRPNSIADKGQEACKEQKSPLCRNTNTGACNLGSRVLVGFFASGFCWVAPPPISERVKDSEPLRGLSTETQQGLRFLWAVRVQNGEWGACLGSAE